MGKRYKKYGYTIAETLFATFICAIGVCLFVNAGLGCDTIDVMLDGIHRTFHITLGQADQIYALIFLLLAFLLNRKCVGIPCIAYTLLIGMMIDGVNSVVIPLRLAEMPFLLQLAAVLLGEACFAVSYALFQTIEKGMNTVDAVVYFFVEKTGCAYTLLRTITDSLFFAIGVIMGGTFGLGTLLYVGLNGMMIAWCRRLLDRLFSKKRERLQNASV